MKSDRCNQSVCADADAWWAALTEMFVSVPSWIKRLSPHPPARGAPFRPGPTGWRKTYQEHLNNRFKISGFFPLLGTHTEIKSLIFISRKIHMYVWIIPSAWSQIYLTGIKRVTSVSPSKIKAPQLFKIWPVCLHRLHLCINGER